MHKRLYIGPYPNRYPVLRTLGIPSGFLLALAAVLEPSLVPPPAEYALPQIDLDDLTGDLEVDLQTIIAATE